MTRSVTYSSLFTPGMSPFCIRQMTAREELAVQDAGTATCVSLISSLVMNNGSQEPACWGNMASADIDRILALVYCENYGPQIRGRLRCDNCETDFDIDFLLPAFESFLNTECRSGINETGEYEFDGHRFRLPTADDELAISGLDHSTAIQLLLQRCTLSEHLGDPAVLQEHMASIAPLLQKEITGSCPECRATKSIVFDIRVFLLTKILQEKKNVFNEVHLLASVYKWSHNEILQLPRNWRKKYVNCIRTNGDLP